MYPSAVVCLGLMPAVVCGSEPAVATQPEVEKGQFLFSPAADCNPVPNRYRLGERSFEYELTHRVDLPSAEVRISHLTFPSPVETAQTVADPSPGSDTGEPDLSGLGGSEKQSIESACAADKLMEGPAAYNTCVRKQLDALKAAPKAPDLSHLSGPERDSIELTCASAKLMRGPAEYNACLVRQVDALKKPAK